MSKRGKQKSDENARIKIGKLARQDKELKNSEAQSVRGGGGVSGGVLGDKAGQIIRKPTE